MSFQSLADRILNRRSILVVGASVRAAAQSLVAGGYRVLACDLFGDADLREIATVVQDIGEDTVLIPQILKCCRQSQPPVDAWAYVGGWENSPERIDRWSKAMTSLGISLHGASPAMLRSLRNPWWLAEVSQRAGLKPLRLQEENKPRERDVRWLWKPFRSAAGRGIRDAGEHEEPATTKNTDGYFQERSEGRSVSSLWMTDARGSTECLGWMTVPPAVTSSPYWYHGSEGPIVVPEDLREAATLLAKTIVQETSLRGLWGLDAVLDKHGLRPLEINPRYTAACEILERCSGRSLMREHLAAWESAPGQAPPPEGANSKYGLKRILYLSRPLPNQDLISLREAWRQDGIILADISQYHGLEDSVLESGMPWCTLIGLGETKDEVVTKINKAARMLVALAGSVGGEIATDGWLKPG